MNIRSLVQHARHKMKVCVATFLANNSDNCYLINPYGGPYQVFPMALSDRNDVITKVFKARAVIVGSPTFNQGVLPTISPILEDLKGLKFQNKIGAAFGSYGWSGEAIKIIEEHLTRCKIQLVTEGVRAKWQPNPDDLAKCRELGQKVAQAINA